MGSINKIMGFFFGKPKKREIEDVNVSHIYLQDWMQKEIDYKFDKVEADVRECLNNLTQAMELLKEKLENLNNARLQNENIPVRAKQLMEGNSFERDSEYFQTALLHQQHFHCL